jgi:hypothetical protein
MLRINAARTREAARRRSIARRAQRRQMADNVWSWGAHRPIEAKDDVPNTRAIEPLCMHLSASMTSYVLPRPRCSSADRSIYIEVIAASHADSPRRVEVAKLRNSMTNVSHGLTAMTSATCVVITTRTQRAQVILRQCTIHFSARRRSASSHPTHAAGSAESKAAIDALGFGQWGRAHRAASRRVERKGNGHLLWADSERRLVKKARYACCLPAYP